MFFAAAIGKRPSVRSKQVRGDALTASRLSHPHHIVYCSVRCNAVPIVGDAPTASRLSHSYLIVYCRLLCYAVLTVGNALTASRLSPRIYCTLCVLCCAAVLLYWCGVVWCGMIVATKERTRRSVLALGFCLATILLARRRAMLLVRRPSLRGRAPEAAGGGSSLHQLCTTMLQ